MATTSDTLEIIIRLKDKASRGIKTLGSGITAMKTRVGNLTKSFTGLKAAIATVGAGLIARSFVQAADTAEQYRVRLNVLLGSTKEGNRAFKEMADYASTVSYSYEEIMGSATALAGVMDGGVEEIKKWMPMIADLAAVAGVTVQEATSQIIRMYSAGAGAADLFRDRGILAMLGFQAKTAYTAEQTRKMLIDAFEDPASKFRGVSQDLAKTWSGMLSMMGDRWFQFRNLVMEEGGVFDYMKAAVMVWLDYTDKLSKEGKLDDWAKSIGDAVINTFEKVLLGAAAFYDAIQPILHNFKVILGSVFDVWQDMPDWMKDVGLVVGILGGKKVAAALIALFHLYNAAVNVGKGLALTSAGTLKFKEFAHMNFEELDKFIKEYEASFNYHAKEIEKDLEGLGEGQAETMKVKVQEFLNKLHEIRAKLQAEREKEEGPTVPRVPKGKPVDTKLVAAQTKAEAKVAIAENKTMLAAIEADWAQHNMTMKEYFDERLRLLNEFYEIQRQMIEEQLAVEKDPKKQLALRAELAALEEQMLRDQIALQQDYTEETKNHAEALKETANIIRDIQSRIAQSGAGVSIAAQQELETAELLRMQQEEIDQLLELKRQGAATEEQINAAKNQHILEQEQLAAQQKKDIWDMYIGSLNTILTDMTSMFLDFYKASGEKSKELFNVFKAASIAQALIATYESAVKAYNAMVGIPIVGPTLATTAAAVAIAAGMAKVRLIQQQEMAEGGPVGAADVITRLVPKRREPAQRPHVGRVPGVSPHGKADNIDIKATAGEFMHPVDVVKYYGIRGMEVIRRKLVPREILDYYTGKRTSIAKIVIDKGVQVIKRAAGGIIPGISPHTRADNIDIKATAGEFMQPVQVVQYYGEKGMEVIRRMLVPPEIINAFAAPGFTIPRGARLAEGGIAARDTGGPASEQTLNMGVNISLPEHLDFIGRRLESEIEPLVLRVLQEELKY